MKIKIYKLFGFTLLELMITIAIVAILVTLATPASFYQQTSAVNYATKATQHAKIFTSYINDNYTAIYNAAKTSSPQSITAVTVSNYTGGVAMVDSYGAVPCATVRYNTLSQKLEMYMYYSGGSGINSNIIASANNYLSGVSGQLVGSNYVGAFGTWSTLATSITSGTCGTSSANGLAINLNLLTTQSGNMQSDLSLHRVLDSANVIGTANNYNTMQTDVIMGYASPSIVYSGIYFTESTATNKPYLVSGASSKLVAPYNTGNTNDIVAQSASLVAKSFMPESPVASLSGCSAALVGKIVADNTTPSGSNVVSNLQCSYDTVNCATATPNANYCYLPMMSKSTTYTGGTLSSFSCLPGSYLDISVPPVITPVTPTNATLTISGATIPNCTSWINVGPTTFTYTPDPQGRITTIRGTTIYMGGSPASTAGCADGTLYAVYAIVKEVTCRSIVY